MRKQVSYSILVLAVLLICGAFIAGCTTTPSTTPATPAVTAQQTVATTAAPTTAVATPAGPQQKLVVATTTSLYDTGLLTYLQPKFEAMYNVKLLITSQGTGKAIELANRGDADVLLVHSPSQEMTFLEGGHGLNRRTFAYNYFVIVGPASDPAGIKGMSPEDAFRTIMAKGKAGDASVAFVSRGDSSGTHSAEQTIWKNAGYNYANDVQKSGKWYVEAGKGMGETLQMASEKNAYTLTDEGTYLAYKNKLNLVPIVSEGASLMNLYSVMAVYNDKQPVEKIQMANNFINFLISNQTMADIGKYDMDKDGNKLGKTLFVPLSLGVPKGVTADFTTPAVAIRPLKVYHAGSLATSFGKLKKVFEKANPENDVQLWSGGSGTIIDKVTKQSQFADVLASADTVLIPKNMYPTNATYDIDFAKNSMVLCYTNSSKYANEITADNWYKILARPDVKYAISDPTSDPAGYRSLMTIALAERYYGDFTIFATIVSPYSKLTETLVDSTSRKIDATTPTPDGKKLIITKTGPDIVPLLKNGNVDYAFEYSSVAIQNNIPYVSLPKEIDLSDAGMSDRYLSVTLIRPSGSTTVTESATPIIYGVTVPTSAHNAAGGVAFVNMLIGKDGQAILSADGQTPIVPALASGTKIPDALIPNVKLI